MVDRTFFARFAVDEFVGKLFEEEPLPYWAKLGVVLRHIAAAERTNIDFILDIILLVKLKMLIRIPYAIALQKRSHVTLTLPHGFVIAK